MAQSNIKWSLSTEDGASLTAEELVTTLASQHDRFVATWQSLSLAQWATASRNDHWTVHETARHVADVMEAVTSEICDEPWPFAAGDFDPNVTPDAWLARSARDSPTRTIERYAATAARFRERVGERLAAGDSGTALTPYGPAHWTMLVIHGFWDAWLHERDIVLPLEVEATGPQDEQRLAALYSMLLGVVAARMLEQPTKIEIQLTGPVTVVAAASYDGATVRSAEVDATGAELAGDLGAVVDSLSGRGQAIADALPGAPELFTLVSAFLNPA